MNMKTIKWLGEHRIIPGYSVARRGQEITLPKNIADSYIAQGMAQTLPDSQKSLNKSGLKSTEKKGG